MKPVLVPTVAWVALAAVLAFGCASPPVVPVQQAGTTDNPATGPAVKIAGVKDQRTFQSVPTDSLTPWIGSDDPAIRARAVAGDGVMLGAGSSVEQVVSAAVARALRAAGFRVLEAGDPGSEAATPLRLGIEQLWMASGSVGMEAWVDTEIRVRIAGPLPGLEGNGEVVEVRRKLARGGWTFGMWQQALGRALDVLTQKAQVELEAVRAGLETGEGGAPAPTPDPS